MQNKNSLKLHRYEIVVILIAAIIIIPSFVIAQPSAIPPTGNISAVFNSLRVGSALPDPGSGNAYLGGKLQVGTIENPNMAVHGGTVRVDDDRGFEVANGSGTVGLAVSQAGSLSNPSGTVKVSDDQGLEIANSGGTAQLQIRGTDGGISNLTGSVAVLDDLNVSGSVRATGHLSAGSFGGYSYWWYNSGCSGAGCSIGNSYSCPVGETLINCGAAFTTDTSRITRVYAWGDTCYVRGINEGAGATTLYAYLKCLAPAN
ncbi:hypothetical protein KKH03_01965 [Patescibacteria group bacterium]|nr:hypothetical protein [Patescibacteria group bacterium]